MGWRRADTIAREKREREERAAKRAAKSMALEEVERLKDAKREAIAVLDAITTLYRIARKKYRLRDPQVQQLIPLRIAAYNAVEQAKRTIREAYKRCTQ